jgi:hypothetical protein
MSSTAARGRSAWDDRFRTPSFEEVRDLSGKQAAGLIDAARARLLETGDLREELSWHGLPWRWSLSYRHAMDTERSWAILVLQPNKPAVSVPLTSDVLSRMPITKLPRAVRDGLRGSCQVNGVYWPRWEFTARSQIDEIFTVLDHKRNLLQSAATG